MSRSQERPADNLPRVTQTNNIWRVPRPFPFQLPQLASTNWESNCAGIGVRTLTFLLKSKKPLLQFSCDTSSCIRDLLWPYISPLVKHSSADTFSEIFAVSGQFCLPTTHPHPFHPGSFPGLPFSPASFLHSISFSYIIFLWWQLFLCVKSLTLAFAFLPGSSSKVSLFAQQLRLEPSQYRNSACPMEAVLFTPGSVSLRDCLLQYCLHALRVEPWYFFIFSFLSIAS